MAYSCTNIGNTAVSLHDDLPTVLAYPYLGKHVTSAYKLSAPKLS
jgi:hypothetical protein